MTAPDAATVEAARDRLYGLLPAHTRSVDAANGWPLLAYVQVLAAGMAEADAEIETLYTAMFVETASDRALPDIAALVAAEPLRPLPPGSGISQRAYVANTIRYRRGKGTARVLEALANDVTGYGSVVVEYFQRLVRTQNLIDVRPERPGTALIVPGETRALVGSCFDWLPRAVDIRSIARAFGRYHVPNVGVHVLRPVTPVFEAPEGDNLAPDKLAGVPAMRLWPDGSGAARPGYFQLAAQPGHMIRLFNPDRRSQDERPRIEQSDLADRLRRLPLHLETQERRHAALEGRAAVLAVPPWFDAATGEPFTIFLRYAGQPAFRRVKPEEIRIANLDVDPGGSRTALTDSHVWWTAGPAAVEHSANAPIACGFDPATGRLITPAPAGGEPEVEEVRIAYATGIGRAIGAGAQDRSAPEVPFDILDTPTLRHFVRIVDAAQPETGVPASHVRRVQTLATALAEWQAIGQSLRGIIVLSRCDIDSAGAVLDILVHRGADLHLVAARWRPPRTGPGIPSNPDRLGYVIRSGQRFTIDRPVRVLDSGLPATLDERGTVTLDGLELTRGLALGAAPATEVCIRHSTVRNPGATAISTTAALDGLHLRVENAIMGPIDLEAPSPGVGRLSITGSIVAADGAPFAIHAEICDSALGQVTLFGTSRYKTLEATDVIFADAASAARRQTGCVRYSSIAEGSSLPRRFRCQPDLAIAAAAEKKASPLTAAERHNVTLGVTPILLDRSLDEPTVALLHPACSAAIRLGGENEREMGAFAFNAEGLRIANLTSLFDDYVPFGLEAAPIDDTRSSAAALRCFKP